MSQRPDGPYWVQSHGGDWIVLCSQGGRFGFGSVSYPDEAFAQIGPPCSRDDAEQLAKAREVLRALVIESHSQVCAPAPDANSAVGEPTFVQTDEAPESQADAYELKLARAISEVRALQNELANEQASSGQVHEAQKRTIAELEEKLKIPPARVLSEALQNDSSYAWAWHSNLAVCFIDAGGTHTQANKAAAQFMFNAFGVNVTSFSEWKALGFRNSNPQFRIAKPGVYLTSEGKQVRVLDRVDGSWLARFSDEMRTFFVLADGVVPGETFFIQSYRGEL